MGKNTQTKVNREFSSGGVVFRKFSDEIKWLVSASTPSKLYPEIRWRLPKGRIDDMGNDTPGPMARGEVRADEVSLQNGALREVREEGGVEARVIKKIGSEKYFFNSKDRGRILKFVTFYLMEWKKDLPEGFGPETSEVLWLPFEEAKKKLSFGGEKQILKKAKDILAS